MIKVAIVEDTADQRDALFQLVNGSPGFTCVTICASAEEALIKIPRARPDVVLMDIQLPGQSGIDAVRQLKHDLPGTQFMMLTVLEDHDRIFQALAAGATGYLVKKTAPARLLEAIQELDQGGAPMSGQIARQVVTAFQGASSAAPASNAMTALSPREQEILHLLAQGFLYKEIVDRLGISLGTVRTHIRKIYDKLHVCTRTDAINKAFPRIPAPRA
jgi:DNA-binding NarL/FixJ family response regulator